MKNLFNKIKYLILCLVIMFTTGCVKYNVNMDIETDNVTLGIVYAFEKEAIKEYGGYDSFKELPDAEKTIKEFKDMGYKVIDYESHKYTGIEATISLGKLKDLSKGTGEEIPISEIINIKEFDKSRLFNYDKKIYSANYVFIKEGSEDEESIPLEGEYIFTVNLPAEVYAHNATETSNNERTLIWEIPEDSEKIDINFSFKTENSTILTFVFLILGGLILVFMVTVIGERLNRHMRKRVLTESDVRKSEGYERIRSNAVNENVDEAFIDKDFGMSADSDPIFSNINNELPEDNNYIKTIDDYNNSFEEKKNIQIIPEDAIDEKEKQ